ncbi:MAG: glutathione peroxidase [Treponema sp.]|jgi:glutathione peroxidase|nr:glutathione peroxidase [Treponema sp.]
MGFYDFIVKGRAGDDLSLEQYKGKVALVVNTATHCGFTPQYEGLQKLYASYKEKGFEILDFPCNQFGKQAPGTNDEIHSFCTMKYATTFTQFGKIEVNGKSESPLYTWLKSQKKGMFNAKIKWNFTKFLIDRNGNVVARYGPNIKPEIIEGDVKSLL